MVKWLKVIWLGIGLVLWGKQAVSQQKPPGKKVNIIYIYADDLGIGDIGPYGQEKIRTPHLDRMAREGMRFTQHYAGAPVCAPSRCMLLTGKHSGNSYIRGNYELGGFADSLEGGQMPLPEGINTLPKMLQNAGYRTALVGKWGLGMNNTTGSPLKQGFDYAYGYLDQKQAHNHYPTHLWENGKWDTLDNPRISIHSRIDSTRAGAAEFEHYKGRDYAGDQMTEKALAFMDSNKRSPFFLYLAYAVPHLALQAPDKYLQPYLGKFPERPYYGQKGYSPIEYPMSTYAAMVSYLDAQVGIIMEKVKQLGLDGQTLIMFSSDNGPAFNGIVDPAFFRSAADYRGLKMDLYEGGIRVPFIVRWPGMVPAGKASDHLSAQFDLFATLAELTGQKAGQTDGISLLPVLTGRPEKQSSHPFLYFEYPENGGQVAVRMGKWKGVRYNLRKDPASPWQLYDLEADPAEQKDRSSLHPEILRQLDAIVKQEHTCSHIKEWEIIDPKFDVKSKTD